MIDNDMLQAMSDMMENMMDKMFDKKLNPIKKDVTTIKLKLENFIEPNIDLIIDSYVPSAKNFNNASNSIDELISDVEMLKKTVTNHSKSIQELQKIS